jgi:putative RecB family exonuclease
MSDSFHDEPSSHSRLNTWESCPLKFRLRYIEKRPATVTGIEALLGNLVHESLEHLYLAVREGRVPPEEEIQTVFASLWSERCDDTVRIVRRNMSREDYRRRGEKFLADYYRAHQPFDKDETLGTEVRVEMDLDPAGGYPFVGFVDRLARAADGAIEIHDYKTSATLPSDEKLRSDRQLRLYALALRSEYPEETPFRLVWNYLAHGRRIPMPSVAEENERVRRDAVRLIDEIRAAREFPPRESALCDWCEYRLECPVGQRRALFRR